jgi:hypothetical protein
LWVFIVTYENKCIQVKDASIAPYKSINKLAALLPGMGINLNLEIKSFPFWD